MVPLHEADAASRRPPASTPVPDLRSLLVKIGMMREQEMDEVQIAGRPVLEVLEEDVQRLLG